MRIASLLPIVLTAAFSVMPAQSQDAGGAGSPASHSAITGIAVAKTADSVKVEVTFTKLVQPEVSRVEHPDRLVFTFADCSLASPGRRIVVDHRPVLAVRTAEFSASPPVARVVIDLGMGKGSPPAPAANKVVADLSSAGNKLVIKVSISNAADASASPAAASDGSDNPPTPVKETIPPRPAEGLTAPILTQRTTQRTTPPSAPVRPPSVRIERSPISPARAYALLDKARALSVSDLDELETKAQAGDPESETTLGLAYHAGTLLKRNDAEGLGLLHQAASRGFVAAEEAMGIFCQMGFGMPPDSAQAVSWYTKAAEHGSIDAANDLGLMYSSGTAIPKDAVKAATWFRKAAEAGDATAQLNLAAAYHRGDGLPQDDAQAAEWLTKAANQGLLPAIRELATWNLQAAHGRDIDAAIRWLTKAGEMGDPTAQAELGDIFVDQKLGRVDYAQAVKWYQKAADQGQREGQFGLGTRYLLGQGVPQNPEEARRWLTPAADRGHPFAAFLLAKMLEGENNGPVDTAFVRKYYETAANYGIPEAQYRLGLSLASDRSDATSVLSAYKWLVLAQDALKESATTAQELRKLLSPVQIAQAEAEIDAWRTAHSRPSPIR